ncbi:hypothetical protein OKA04_09710 [Luteolibacter flavescens]|uniref:DUF3618 domain-containing protein n=1 Tax=Luteolibacter flavescens TaxID=1859460 RepID=A0ABT3FN59_9BACT|nr:hypothetical protein [Luteolibacter flavescens]MCW1885002.1 hypothetical protein [Luteolibacter flavescens]
MNFPFHDRRAASLLSKVREDISHLRSDVGNLFHHTTSHTVPQGARALADTARDRILDGGHYAASRLRSLRSIPQRQAVGIGVLGGAILVGGIYAVIKSESCARARAAELDEESHDDIPV